MNGVDQGTGVGIRTPAYNGPPPKGYANSPVKDLNSIDMRCNVMGDKAAKDTIKVKPGDNITLDWWVALLHAVDGMVRLTALPGIMMLGHRQTMS